MDEWISGRNPVFETLKAGRRQPYVLHLAEGAQIKGRLADVLDLCQTAGVRVEIGPRRQLDRISSNHQGVALNVDGYPYSAPESILDSTSSDEPGLILLLDTIQDPQNMGTLLRTAEAVGVHGVFIPLKRTATVTPAVVHASSGATEHLLITQANLARSIETIKDHNYWVIGLENAPDALPPNEIRLDGQVALVVGSEGRGMRRLIRESCDLLMRLPIQGEIGSLNAAVAGSLALFLAWTAQGYGKTM